MSDLASIPVLVRVARDLDGPLRRQIEGILGWQVVDEDLRSLVRPVVAFVDDGEAPVDVPVVQVLDAVTSPAEAATRAVRLRPVAVVRWPDDHDALPAIVRGVRASRDEPDATGSSLAVAGAAGGVGATTVTLALAGLSAWDGRPSLAVVRGDVPVPDVPVVGADALRGPAPWNAAAEVSGVPGLRVLAVLPGQTAGALALPSVPDQVRVLHEVGQVPGAADVLVARRDRAGRDAIAASPAGAIVLLDDGPLAERDVLAGAGGRRVVVLPWSHRVARAGAARRVPASLPGAWLAPLRGLTVSSTGGETAVRPRDRNP